MIFGMTWYQLCWYFLSYSFLGWVVEVAYHVVTLGKIINRGFLNGPVCPVYGFGAVGVFAIINTIQKDGPALGMLAVFFIGMVLATMVELIAGWALDVLFHARWWDYSNNPFNLHGYICLEFSIYWGLAIVFVVRILHDTVSRFTVGKIPPKVGWILLALSMLAFVVDVIVTVLVIQGFNKKLHRLDDMQKELRAFSDRLSEAVGQRTLKTMARVENGQLQVALAKAEFKDSMEQRKADYEELLRKQDRMQKDYEKELRAMLGNPFVGQGHLIKAFPNMKHRSYQSVIEDIQNREM